MEVLAGLIPGVSAAQLLAIWVAILLAAVLRAFTGFGFALAAVPVFSLFLSPAQSVVLSASLSLAIGLVSVRSYWGQVEPRGMLPLVVLAVLGTLAGAALLVQLSAQNFRLWIGLSVIAACLVLSFYRPGKARPRPWLGAFTGALSGLLNGAFAIPGPPVIIYAMATQREPAKARALLISFFTVSSLAALCSFALAGLVHLEALWLLLLCFPVMFVGDKFGLLLFRRYGSALYRRVALVTLYVIGISTTARALLG